MGTYCLTYIRHVYIDFSSVYTYKIDVDTNSHISIRQKWTPSHLYETDLDTDRLTCKTYKKDEDINCPICLRHVDTNCHT